jgi:hypothetical protein
VSKPGVDQLLIQAAIDPDTLRRLEKSPGEVFDSFELTGEERDILRHPDARLLGLLGRALRSAQPPASQAVVREAEADAAPAILANTLQPTLLALTVVPCLNASGGLQFAVWVNPIAEGAIPATLPPPPGTALPGAPLAPLYAVIELDGVHTADAEGNPQVALWAQLRQATNIAPAAAQTLAASDAVDAAAEAARTAPPHERYERLAQLVRAIEESGR